MRRIPIQIDPMFGVYLVWMLLTDRSGIALATLLAAGIHEGGHLAAASLLRIPMRRLRLDLPGARLDAYGRMLTPGEEWLLCSAGPLASLCLSVAVSPLWDKGSFFLQLSCISLLLGLLNLLPVRGFDGGRMLEAGLSRFVSPRVIHILLGGLTFGALFLLWAIAVYFLILAGDGLSMLCFSLGLLLRFFDGEEE